jgi:hypothetical protein
MGFSICVCVLLSLSGVNDFGLLGNWFWRVGSVANQFWGNGVAEILLGVESLCVCVCAHAYVLIEPYELQSNGFA